MPPTRKKQPRKAGVVLNLGVRIELKLDKCEELLDGACCLEAKRTSDGNEVILPLV
jgi:hypothetical protein